MPGGFDNNTKVVSLGKYYTRLERGEKLQLTSRRTHEPEYVRQMWH
jgi:hypothetical protein